MVIKRNTWQRDTVRTEMRRIQGFISAQGLYDQLRLKGLHIGLATVYRTLSSMTESGEADMLNSPDGENLFRFCKSNEHHHHLICRECGYAKEIEATPVEAWAAQVAHRNGFTQAQHIIDIFGICANCQSNPPANGAK
ncbi:transcriptional repressor [Canibacter sp. lx-72]|uniref:Fur family transcriptional regulator n=1 Tax=Canibacter zhuwentaonis TaxID=2837491 RepID=UPI001BDD6918|nr:transcriptional repressor [Canibacter zhuwentaonis]MBT1018574.1 transcriptional repressor [Canibacter zhuwentaonis]MBT1035771.1 transcriptional repressor [Canibacter zhuwentaonis]